MTERILAIPATSAPSERVFSFAANIVDKKRVRLKPENVDLLVFLRGNTDFVDWEYQLSKYLICFLFTSPS